MRNKDALDAIEQLEFMAREGRKIVKDGHQDAEVTARNDNDRALLYFLEFIWGMRPEAHHV